MADPRIPYLKDLEQKVLWLAAWTIHNANHLRESGDSIKVGGHQASSASMVSLLSALYFAVLKPADRVAVKPHASPVYHAIQYLFGNQTREKLQAFRGLGGAQSYPSRTKDIDDVDFSTGSVGLGVGITAFAAMMRDYIKAKNWPAGTSGDGRMIALVGDAELDEGNIYECLLEGWKHGLRNTWWIIDYNRQSLDGVVREGLYDRIEKTFAAFGWNIVTLKYGVLQQQAFEEPGGDALKSWIDNCPNPLYSALTFQGGAAWRKRLLDDLGDQGDVSALIEGRSDAELAELMANLGGHCLETILHALENINTDQPVCFIAYTVKGWGLPIAGHKDNHAGLMTPAQIAEFKKILNIRDGREWEPFEGLETDAKDMQAFLDDVPFVQSGRRRYSAPQLPIPAMPQIPGDRLSTQEGFGKILNEIGREKTEFSDRILTTAPDVTVSTNLGAWVNRRGLFAQDSMADVFREENVASTQKWAFGPDGQHIELGIAEMNLFLLLGAAGLSHTLFGERVLPIGTLYDPFISRGLDALNYACYQDARFMLVATPSGVSLAPEGGAHQSIGTPLIGLSQDGLAAFEPAFVDELGAIMGWSFDYMQKDGDGEADEKSWLRDQTGGSVYLRLSTVPLQQPKRALDGHLRDNIINGAYWVREPGPNCEVVIAYQGVIAPEAIRACGLLAEDRRDIGLLAVTSADRLNAGWQAAQRQRSLGRHHARSHIERLFENLPNHAGIITIIDGHPATLAWLGGVVGNRVQALGVEHFGQTGTTADLYRHYGIDAEAILSAARALTPRKPVRFAPMRVA